MNSYDLSICVVTMNRANQLSEALESCIKCNLPKRTEFVIIDNASTDNTQEVVKDFFENNKYTYYYEKLPENLGVGGGRNYAFNKSSGKYFYMLDDDAVIDDSNPEFFKKAINIFEKHDKTITLTTQIYDTKWKQNRVDECGKKLFENIYNCYMFCGGSHFFRKSFFEKDPYFGNKYGYEEIVPSMRVVDADCFNVFVPDLLVIHKPIVDKWDYKKNENNKILISAYATPYAIKKMLYPKVFTPILFFFYTLRKAKYIKDKSVRKMANELCKQIAKEHKVDGKIKFATVVRQFRNFGVSTF